MVAFVMNYLQKEFLQENCSSLYSRLISTISGMITSIFNRFEQYHIQLSSTCVFKILIVVQWLWTALYAGRLYHVTTRQHHWLKLIMRNWQDREISHQKRLAFTKHLFNGSTQFLPNSVTCVYTVRSPRTNIFPTIVLFNSWIHHSDSSSRWYLLLDTQHHQIIGKIVLFAFFPYLSDTTPSYA